VGVIVALAVGTASAAITLARLTRGFLLPLRKSALIAVSWIQEVKRRIYFLQFALNVLVILPREVSAQTRKQFALSRNQFCEQHDCSIEVIVFVATHETVPTRAPLSCCACRLATA
jgi:hypothetical protein